MSTHEGAQQMPECSALKIKLDVPDKWHRNKAWLVARTPMIIATAYNPHCWAIGFEVLNGYGKGLAVMVGPLWIGFAVAGRIALAPIEARQGQDPQGLDGEATKAGLAPEKSR